MLSFCATWSLRWGWMGGRHVDAPPPPERPTLRVVPRIPQMRLGDTEPVPRMNSARPIP